MTSELLTIRKYIGRSEMGFCGHACCEFIQNLPVNEKNEWKIINIRTLKDNKFIYLQDVRGALKTPNHVLMIKYKELINLTREDEFNYFLTQLEVYDPLYNLKFKNMLYYICFFYTKTPGSII